MKKVINTTLIIILTILLLKNNLYSEPTSEPINKESNVKENIIVQVKKINKKVKKAEIATKEMLTVIKKLIEQKKLINKSNQDNKDFLNRVIK
tara:strand:- start:15 stop:293 length:279 start_codon:yes stop_codon:yes gene_type:complete